MWLFLWASGLVLGLVWWGYAMRRANDESRRYGVPRSWDAGTFGSALAVASWYGIFFVLVSPHEFPTFWAAIGWGIVGVVVAIGLMPLIDPPDRRGLNAPRSHPR